jgi:hypothetical protein
MPGTPTTTTITWLEPGIGAASPSPVGLANEVDFTVTVQSTSGIPSGTVTLTNTTTNSTLGTATLDNTGTAVFQVVPTDPQNALYTLPYGSNAIKASYNPAPGSGFASSSVTATVFVTEGFNTGTIILNNREPVAVVLARKGRTDLHVHSTGCSVGPDPQTVITNPYVIHSQLQSQFSGADLQGYEGALWAMALTPNIAEQGIILVDPFHSFLVFYERFR